MQAVSSTQSAQQQQAFSEGRCRRVTAEGMFFTVDSWDGGKHIFGPAPWPGGPEPAAGTLVLVVFLGGGVSRPWVTAVAGEVSEPAGVVPISGIIPSMTATAIPDWVVLDGSTIVGGATLYPELWDLLPGSWKSGSDIVLADARGRTLIGAGTGSGLTARTLGAVGGSESTTLTAAQSGMPGHTHGLNDPGHNHSQNPHSHTVSSAGSLGGTYDQIMTDYLGGGGNQAAVPQLVSGVSAAGAPFQAVDVTATNNAQVTGQSVVAAAAVAAADPHTNMQPWLAATPIMRCR